MRTIKFRGKRHYGGEWVYGYPLIVDTEKYKSVNIVTMHEAYPDTLAKVTTSVDFNTLGQFTGMFDEDGHEIYEGDIIKIVEEYDDENVYTQIGVVCFEEGMYELQDKNGKHFAYLGWLMHDDSISKLEVIGNIHDNDNPELLT